MEISHKIEEREVKRTLEVSVVTVKVPAHQVRNILLEHVQKHKLEQFKLLEPVETTVEPVIDWRGEEFEGFEIELQFAGVVCAT